MAPLVRHVSTNHHGSYCMLDIKSCKKKPLDDFGEILSATKTAKDQQRPAKKIYLMKFDEICCLCRKSLTPKAPKTSKDHQKKHLVRFDEF